MDDRKAFELEIRKLADEHFDRTPPEGHIMQRMIDGTLPIEEARELYGSMWPSFLVFNRVLLPRLLEKAPDLASRVALLPVISQEYGNANYEQTHPVLFRRFLVALGVPEEKLSWEIDLVNPNPARDEAEWIRGFSWCEILGRILVGEAIGPVAFGAVARALQKNYGLSEESVRWFPIHYTVDKRDTEIIFDVVRDTILTDADREAFMKIVKASFGHATHRYGLYPWRFEGTTAYRYAPLFQEAA